MAALMMCYATLQLPLKYDSWFEHDLQRPVGSQNDWQRQTTAETQRRGREREVSARSPSSCEDRAPPGSDALFSCLQQALWGKCSASFMGTGVCDRVCGRCSSTLRSRSLSRTLLVSARQAAACTETGADAWVMRAMSNKAEYARAHGMSLTWHATLLDADYDGAWNKVSVLCRLLRHELLHAPRERRSAEWLLWCDWDVIFTDMAFELPLEDYEAAGVQLVLGGDPSGVGGEKADYLKLNSGVMLLRVSNFSLALLERILSIGRPQARRKHALALQRSIKNLCVGCIDDQAVLLHLLREEPTRWAAHTKLERRFLLQVHWEDVIEMLPTAMPAALSAATSAALAATSAEWHPMRSPSAEPLPAMRRPFYGHTRVPLAVHFAGCQLCSGKAAPEKSAKCWPAFRRVVRFAEEQGLRSLGLRHPSQNRSAPESAPLVRLEAPR